MDNLFKRAMSRPKVSAEDVLNNPTWPTRWPFSANDFSRLDPNRDSLFYTQPRIGIFHIDEFAVRALTRYYANVLPPDAHVLDLCSSWVSHLPDKYQPASLTIVGLNKEELDANAAATSRVVQDLNQNPILPFADNSFDVITNVVSVDYMTRPLELFSEMGRVLRPGGRAIMSFSNRCFPTKVVQVWSRTSDLEHVYIVGCYFHFCGKFNAPSARDLKPGVFGFSDPMFVVEATAV